jgi:sulfate adenylyltransferase
MMETIPPHGGQLINRIIAGEEREDWLKRAEEIPGWAVPPMILSDLECIATGVFSPLTGFLHEEDYLAVRDRMRLADGTVWTLPITLPVPEDRAADVREGKPVAIRGEDGRIYAVVEVESLYRVDRRKEAREVFRTEDAKHPGVARLYRSSPLRAGGPIWLLNRPDHGLFNRFILDPVETRSAIRQRGWRRIVGFQTRNPIHRAHEYLTKGALETVDGLLIHPLVGETKSDDVPAATRVDCYRILVDNYYPADRVLVAAFPAAMRYAGPREAIWHAICRKNYGCSHFIVGRDHAGVGDYYGTYDAQLIFDDFEPHELGIEPMFFEHAFFCRVCGSMATPKTCPHGGDDHVFLSGTKVRELLANGQLPPVEFTRPEVAEVLIEAYRS